MEIESFQKLTVKDKHHDGSVLPGEERCDGEVTSFLKRYKATVLWILSYFSHGYLA